MNESIAKKIGEVLAFNRVGSDTIEKSRATLVTALGEEALSDMEEKFKIHGEEVLRIATEAGVVDVVLAKADKTETKLKQMRDLYIGEKWDDATEIMEWSGFFFGAHIVHWAFVRGAAEGSNDQNMLLISEEGINWNYEMLETCESELESRGQDKATA